jgi:long-chain acyl-CoA synthetase
VNPRDAPAGPTLDRQQADVLAHGVVHRLRRRSIEPGERVAFTAANSPHLLAAIFGCLRAGYAPVVLSAALTPYERVELIGDVEPALVVDDELCRDLARPFDGAHPSVLDEHFHCRPLHFTSGTSGRPKAVWSGWWDREIADEHAADERDVWGFYRGDTHLVCAPLSHSAPLRFALHTLLAGGSVVVPPGFEPRGVSELLDSGLVTTTFMAPAHLQRVLDHAPPATPRLRLLAHAGSPCPDAVKRRAVEVFGEAVVEFYGSTEGQFTVCRAEEWGERPGSVGRARAGRTLRVVDGQIWCRVPPAARFEYWGDPAKTAAAWDGDWFTVGDLGRLDADGYLHLEGRRSDLIISGGVNVYPAEVERVLAEVPGVQVVCVFGVEDPTWGQRVCAVVTGEATEEDVRAHAAARLAPYKRPKTVVRVSGLPTTHSGKIDRSRLPDLVPRP